MILAAALFTLAACDRPTPAGAPPGRSPPAHTPRTRSTAAVRPRPAAEPPAESGAPVVLSLAGGGHVLDCRAERYHAGMQAALAAGAATLRCAPDGDGLVLQVTTAMAGPALTIATVGEARGRALLRWVDTDATMDCGAPERFLRVREAACSGAPLRLDGGTLRRTWP